MNWPEALEVVVAQTGHERFRELCADGNPKGEQRDAYRALVIRMAQGESPSLATQAGNLAGAIGRVITAVVTGEPVLVSAEERDRRQLICDGCEHWDLIQRRCKKCGCGALKLHLATEKCPIGKW